jgi:hypothetical protein
MMEEAFRFQSLRMRAFRNGLSMFVESGVISRIWSVRISHIKVPTLRLFHPTVSSVFFGHGFYYYYTVLWARGNLAGLKTIFSVRGRMRSGMAL